MMNGKELVVEKYERVFINSKTELKARPKHRRIQGLVQRRMKLWSALFITSATISTHGYLLICDSLKFIQAAVS